jgi:Ca2+-transporting ATPase
VPWHATGSAEVVAELGSDSERGLSSDDVSERLERYGPNELEQTPPPHPIVVLARQFRSPLIYILVAAAVITLLLREYVDSAVIAVVLLLNAIIGFSQERRAETAVRALMGLVVPHALVVRDGRSHEIESRDLVPGDIVELESGGRVPADLRLITANALRVDESLLTGESVPVDKSVESVAEAAVLADRSSMLFTGATVTTGRARGVVVATGDRTELGAIADMMRSEAIMETPLQKRMTRLAHVIGIAVGIAAALVFVTGVALGGAVGEMFLTAVALAVAAIPEGLPVVFTITLALGVRRMAQRNAIIRRLPAVETLGSTTVIGSDKTGTLTENRMTVTAIWVAGTRYERDGSELRAGFSVDGDTAGSDTDSVLEHALVIGALANEASLDLTGDEPEATGDPTEVALLFAAVGHGLDLESLAPGAVVAEVPFESDRRYSAVIVDRDEGHEVLVKGAPERIIEMCQMHMTADGPVPIDADMLRDEAQGLASEGLRVLAMAWRPPSDDEITTDVDGLGDLDGLVLVGLQGMLDPPRAGVADAIATCHRAGIQVAMITGDHGITARAIAVELGLSDADAEVLTGVDLAGMTDEELTERVDDVNVYARVAPEEKLRIVHAFQRRDHVVAVTGDGVNDAPALRAASIGVAMGRDGTDVAREASDMVLADDNFVSIAAAVEEGRVTFDNVRKVTFFLISTGVAAIIAITLGVWFGWPLLMLPAQLLWLNLVTNGLQDVALAFEPGEQGVLDRPPRPHSEGVLSRMLWERTLVAGIVIAVGTLLMFRWQLDRNIGDDRLMAAQTTALTTMVIFMAFHAGNSRSETRSVLQMNPVSNPFLLIATIAAVSVHIGSLYFAPTQFILRVEPLDLETWMRLVPLAATIIVAMEIHKAIRRRSMRR